MANTGATDLRRADLEALYELASELLKLDEPDAMLDTLVRSSMSILKADRGFLVLKRGEGVEDLDLRVVRNWSREELEGGRDAVSRSIVAETLRLGEPLMVEDALSDPRFSERESVIGKGIRSVLAAPLEADGQKAGVLYLERRSVLRLFVRDDLERFKHILELVSRALEACTRRLLLEQAAEAPDELLSKHDFQGIVTLDPGFLQVLRTVVQSASSDMPVLVQGPSGSGKELVARALHKNSARTDGPFVTINCGAISPQLLESELFGHVRGAFTGATSDKIGVVPLAHRGTLFLDEIGDLPKELQVKLLRTLQFGEVQPVGTAKTQTVDVRFVAATNRDLSEEVRSNRFREDLLYRLNAITLELPPLAARPGDVLPLFHHFLARAAAKANRPVPQVSPQLERALQQYSWPGNVRELENEAGRLLALAPPGQPLTVESLSPRITRAIVEELASTDSLTQREKEQIERHLRLCAGNRSAAARALGISREGLRLKMKRHGIS